MFGGGFRGRGGRGFTGIGRGQGGGNGDHRRANNNGRGQGTGAQHPRFGQQNRQRGRNRAIRGGGQTSPGTGTHKPVSSGLLEEKTNNLVPSDLLFWLLADKGVSSLLNSEKCGLKTTLMLLSAVKKAMDVGRSENLTALLIKIRDSTLFKSLSAFLNGVHITNLADRQIMESLVEALLFIMEYLMMFLPL